MTVKGLSLKHGPLLARMLFWRMTLPVAKRFVATERLVRLLASGPGREGRPEDLPTAVRIASRLWRSAEGPCLERSLALYHELGRVGVEPNLVLAVQRRAQVHDRQVIGHAWVEVENSPLLEVTNPRLDFVPVARFHAHGRREKPSP